MKKKFINLCLCMLLAFTTAFGLAGCNKDKLKIELTVAGNITTVQPGASVQFSAKASDEEVGRPSYRIIEGADFGSISEAGLLTVENDATKDSVIKVEAYIGKTKSNNIALTVEVVEVTSVTLSVANNVTQLERGHDIQLNATVNPSNATNKTVAYQIVSGEEHATLSATGLLKVDADAPVNAVVKVKATSGSKTSNELTFTVIETPESLIEVRFEEDAVTVDAKSNQASKRLIPSAYDVDEKRLTGIAFTYTVVSGSDIVSVDANGVVTPLGHGTAVVRATTAGSQGYGECTITSIVPPTTIELNEELEGKTRFGFGIKDLFSAAAEKPYAELPFVVTGKGTTATQKVSNEYTYKFVDKATNTEDATLATYSNGKVVFADKAVGKDVKIVVTSNSGSAVETKKEFVVSVNNGYNLSTVAQFNTFYAKPEAQLTNLVINLVDDIVFAQKSDVKEMLFYGSFSLYGNGYTLDYSNRDLITRKSTEIIGDHESGNTAAIITINNTLNLAHDNLSDTLYSNRGLTTAIVNIYDINAEGPLQLTDTPDNSEPTFIPSINGLKTLFMFRGADEVHARRYKGDLRDKNGSNTYAALSTKSNGILLDMDNANINGFVVGVRAEFTRNGSKMSNITLENSFYTGIQTVASMLELNNLTIGSAGVYAIEISPDSWYLAGANYNQAQQITFTGDFIFGNLIDFGAPNSYMTGDPAAQTAAQLFANAVSSLPYCNPDDDSFDPYMLNAIRGNGATNVINWEIMVLNDIYETVFTQEKINDSVILFGNTQDEAIALINNPFSAHPTVNTDAPASVKAGNNMMSVGLVVPTGALGNPAPVPAGTAYIFNRNAE